MSGGWITCKYIRNSFQKKWNPSIIQMQIRTRNVHFDAMNEIKLERQNEIRPQFQRLTRMLPKSPKTSQTQKNKDNQTCKHSSSDLLRKKLYQPDAPYSNRPPGTQPKCPPPPPPATGICGPIYNKKAKDGMYLWNSTS